MKAELFTKFIAALAELQTATDLSEGEKSFLKMVADNAALTDEQRAEVIKKMAGDVKAEVAKSIVKDGALDLEAVEAFTKAAGVIAKLPAIQTAKAGEVQLPDFTKFAKADAVPTKAEFETLQKSVKFFGAYIAALPMRPREDWADEFKQKTDDTTGNQAVKDILSQV